MEKAKVVYVARNPMDAMISYYHHHKLFRGHNYCGDLPTFVERKIFLSNYYSQTEQFCSRRFMKSQLMYDPYFEHLKQAWNVKDHKNVLFIYFEEMKNDMDSVIGRVCKFLDVELSKEKVEQLKEHLDFKNFKNNPAVNNEIWKSFGLANQEGNFIRKGQVGGWKKELEDHPQLRDSLLEWVENSCAKYNITFPH